MEKVSFKVSYQTIEKVFLSSILQIDNFEQKPYIFTHPIIWQAACWTIFVFLMGFNSSKSCFGYLLLVGTLPLVIIASWIKLLFEKYNEAIKKIILELRIRHLDESFEDKILSEIMSMPAPLSISPVKAIIMGQDLFTNLKIDVCYNEMRVLSVSTDTGGYMVPTPNNCYSLYFNSSRQELEINLLIDGIIVPRATGYSRLIKQKKMSKKLFSIIKDGYLKKGYQL